MSTFDESEASCGFQRDPPSKMLIGPRLREDEHLRSEPPARSEAEEERAASVEHNGNIPRAWAESLLGTFAAVFPKPQTKTHPLASRACACGALRA
jgi:hypothetical protein